MYLGSLKIKPRRGFGTRRTGRFTAVLVALLLFGCGSKNQVNPELSNSMPPKMLWAWERPEDLRFLDPKKFGVAFLAQTIFLEQDNVAPKPRRQPLQVSTGAYLIAVTRIETSKDGKKRPTFSPEMASKVVSLVKNTLDLPDVKGIQIDFDAVVSERPFYRSMMKKLAEDLATRHKGQGTGSESDPSSPVPRPSLTMTSLASWCTGDAWFNDFPVDEAVPMAFQMGADEEKIKTFLRNGNDWREPLCRGSYGTSIDDPLGVELKPGRRNYYFSNHAWRQSDVSAIAP